VITLNMQLLPGGQGIGRSEILTGRIWSSHDNTEHLYEFMDGDGVLYKGSVEKKISGHKNPFQLLQNVSTDIL
jgi:hypothetical protein